LPPGVEAGFATRHEHLPQKGEKDLAIGEALNAAGWPSIANSCLWSSGWGPISRGWFSHEFFGGLD
jgi:hypothetical protein